MKRKRKGTNPPPAVVDAEELDEYEPGVYLCRWPNGECSAVYAETMREAMIQLDEWGSPDQRLIKRMANFMMDFRLDKDSHVFMKIAQIGEVTWPELFGFCYPILDKEERRAGNFTDDGAPTAVGSVKISKAIEQEESRLLALRGFELAETEQGQRMVDSRHLDVSPAVADYYVKRAKKKAT